MFNITVNLKKLIKKLIVFLVVLIIGLVVIKYSKNIFSKIVEITNSQYAKIFDSEFSTLNYEDISLEKGMQKILSSELVSVETSSMSESDSSREESLSESKEEAELGQAENEEIESQERVQEATASAEEKIDYKNLKTEVIKEKNLKESYNAEYNGVKIKNESNYTLTDDILTPNIEYKDKNDILIFHTHTCEAYTPTEEMSYKETGNYRTTDLNYSVARVGDELTNNLINKDFNVIHDTTYHDYPAYTGSYNRSLLTVKDILQKNPNIQTVIDLHRDAIGSKSEYGPAVKIGDERVAQLMFVIGTDGGGLTHPNWANNLKFAVKIQEKANEMFPGLFRPMIVRNSRYNQNLADGACIIEVGATGNTLEESIGSMKYLAEVLYEVMNS